MNVAQETLGFRRAGLSPALSLLMSAFALPIPPASLTRHLHRPTERSPTTQVTEVREQATESAQAPVEPVQHLRDLLVLIAPTLPRRLIRIPEVQAIANPHAHLV